MGNAPQAIQLMLALAAVASLTGCTLRPNLTEAFVKEGADKTEVVHVMLPSSDARVIKAREIYFSIVLVDCENHEKRFPIEPHIAGKLASNFDFPVADDPVTVEGTAPKHVLAGFPKPCVALQGGSYFFGKLDTTPVPLARLAE